MGLPAKIRLGSKVMLARTMAMGSVYVGAFALIPVLLHLNVPLLAAMVMVSVVIAVFRIRWAGGASAKQSLFAVSIQLPIFVLIALATVMFLNGNTVAMPSASSVCSPRAR